MGPTRNVATALVLAAALVACLAPSGEGHAAPSDVPTTFPRIHELPRVSPLDVVVKDLTIFVDDVEFFIKGVCYSPTPLGAVTTTTGFGGTGLCSARVTPYQEYKSACFDSDYFDGSQMTPGPDGGWFEQLWRRDFPYIKRLGANTVRLYNSNPMTREASLRLYHEGKVLLPVGKSHTAFMDLAHSFGLKVIFPIIFDYNMISRTFESEAAWRDYQELVKYQIDEVGNHPALLMWNVGNEILARDNPNYFKVLGRLQQVINLVKDYQYNVANEQKTWRRIVPVTHAVVDLPKMYTEWVKELPVDVFSANAGYRGLDLTDLFDGDKRHDFPGWRRLSEELQLPLLISEFGHHGDPDEWTRQHPTWFNSIYRDIVRHNVDGCVGGLFFEWSDEHTKADPQQKHMGLVRYHDNGSTIQDVYVADTLSTREPLFESARAGLVDGEPYNYSYDEYKLMSRPRKKLVSN